MERELVHRAHIFADVVDAEARANRCCMVSEEVISQSHTRSISSRIVVVVGCAVGASGQSSDIQTLHARRVDERELPLTIESGIKISNVAKTVMEPSKDLRTEAHIQR